MKASNKKSIPALVTVTVQAEPVTIAQDDNVIPPPAPAELPAIVLNDVVPSNNKATKYTRSLENYAGSFAGESGQWAMIKTALAIKLELSGIDLGLSNEQQFKIVDELKADAIDALLYAKLDKYLTEPEFKTGKKTTQTYTALLKRAIKNNLAWSAMGKNAVENESNKIENPVVETLPKVEDVVDTLPKDQETVKGQAMLNGEVLSETELEEDDVIGQAMFNGVDEHSDSTIDADDLTDIDKALILEEQDEQVTLEQVSNVIHTFKEQNKVRDEGEIVPTTTPLQRLAVTHDLQPAELVRVNKAFNALSGSLNERELLALTNKLVDFFTANQDMAANG